MLPFLFGFVSFYCVCVRVRVFLCVGRSEALRYKHNGCHSYRRSQFCDWNVNEPGCASPYPPTPSPPPSGSRLGEAEEEVDTGEKMERRHKVAIIEGITDSSGVHLKTLCFIIFYILFQFDTSTVYCFLYKVVRISLL